MKMLKLQNLLFRGKKLLLPQPERVLFEHVPKCGGTTVGNFLKSQYLKPWIYQIDGSNTSKSIEMFKSLPQKKRYSFGLVYGHGANQLRKYTHPNTINATILRDPVERIISHYYYVLRSPDHYLYRELKAGKMSLVDYATSRISGELRNNYVCRFLQLPESEIIRNPDESVMNAYNILRYEYSVVGVLEKLDSTMKVLSQKAFFGKKYQNSSLNVTEDRPQKNEIEQSTLNAIADANQLDVRLYELVKNELSAIF